MNNETRMLRTAADTLARNPALAEKMGNNLQSIMALANVLKQRHSDSVVNKILDDAVATGRHGLETPGNRINGGRAILPNEG